MMFLKPQQPVPRQMAQQAPQSSQNQAGEAQNSGETPRERRERERREKEGGQSPVSQTTETTPTQPDLSALANQLAAASNGESTVALPGIVSAPQLPGDLQLPTVNQPTLDQVQQNLQGMGEDAANKAAADLQAMLGAQPTEDVLANLGQQLGALTNNAASQPQSVDGALIQQPSQIPAAPFEPQPLTLPVQQLPSSVGVTGTPVSQNSYVTTQEFALIVSRIEANLNELNSTTRSLKEELVNSRSSQAKQASAKQASATQVSRPSSKPTPTSATQNRPSQQTTKPSSQPPRKPVVQAAKPAQNTVKVLGVYPEAPKVVVESRPVCPIQSIVQDKVWLNLNGEILSFTVGDLLDGKRITDINPKSGVYLEGKAWNCQYSYN
jgi:hypothetical protein